MWISLKIPLKFVPWGPINNIAALVQIMATCGLDDVFPPDDLGSRPEALRQYIYMYAHSLYEFCYRTYIYTTGVSFSIGEAAPHHVL